MTTTVVNKYRDDFDVYIGRGSKWGNPYSHLPSSYTGVIKVDTREEAIEKFEIYLLTNENLMNDLGELKGKRLGCFCKPKACHGDVLAKYAEMV